MDRLDRKQQASPDLELVLPISADFVKDRGHTLAGDKVGERQHGCTSLMDDLERSALQ